MTKRKIETIAVTAGRNFDTQIGAVMPPIHLTTTFIRGNEGEFIYSSEYTHGALSGLRKPSRP